MLLLFLCITCKVLDFLIHSGGTSLLLALIVLPIAQGNDNWLDSLLNAFDVDAERVLVDQHF